MVREAEMVNGTWYSYFTKIHDIDDIWLTNKTCVDAEVLLDKLYGDFFDRNLSPSNRPLLSLGAGYGLTEIPLARKGFKVIGIDNDTKLLEILRKNATKYGKGNVEVKFGDLYDDFHKEYVNQGIQACISFGVLEHFKREDLDELIKKQFEISPLILSMVPINTPKTLKAFNAVDKPVAHIDEYGIYRNFWSESHWRNNIFKNHEIIDICFPVNYSSLGQVDMVTHLVRE